MIELFVEHFFTAEGRQRFPAWIREIEAIAGRYPGFIGIRQMTRPDEPDRCFFRMSFRTPQQAERWITSPDRKRVLARMEPFQSGDLHATRWITAETASAPI
ncbi:hypothetical protein AWC29_02720 [Mycobacterium triplex]|uniref:Antibiotic biosynthesis monooxygenase n=1 Tax=Mycobacterium triplex TaxID=47839 RepID=A0A024JX49_9MYCO|nr:hypothetical protein [Mycobacterium triplex]ORX00865.1 hypothetical protein AWC29_02720 [Mycobacterium triplex]CDO87932.1 hypothetical protein BN973_02290 [Mycobacterium triplex]